MEVLINERTELNIFGKDYDKPLTPFGKKEAEKMGEYLSELNYTPDLIISLNLSVIISEAFGSI